MHSFHDALCLLATTNQAPTEEQAIAEAIGVSPSTANAASKEVPKVDHSALPIRAYLDQTVVPILLQGLSKLVKERCEIVLNSCAYFTVSICDNVQHFPAMLEQARQPCRVPRSISH